MQCACTLLIEEQKVEQLGCQHKSTHQPIYTSKQSEVSVCFSFFCVRSLSVDCFKFNCWSYRYWSAFHCLSLCVYLSLSLSTDINTNISMVDFFYGPESVRVDIWYIARHICHTKYFWNISFHLCCVWVSACTFVKHSAVCWFNSLSICRLLDQRACLYLVACMCRGFS